MKHKIRIGAIILCALITALVLSAHALAANTIDLSRDCTLSISFRSGTTPIIGAEFEIYRAADVFSDGTYALTEAFASYPINKDNLSDLAPTLEGFILRDGLKPLDTGVTNASGQVDFPNRQASLKPGIYLVRSADHAQNGFIYSTAPFMVFLPGTNQDGTGWLYDLDALVKGSSSPDTPTGGDDLVDRKVLKVWDDEGFEKDRPRLITVYLLRDGKVFDTVTLSKRNNWTYIWHDLSDDFDWTVVEAAPDGYTVSVDQVGITFVITNSKTTSEPTKEPEVTPTPTPTPGVTPTPTPSNTPSVTPSQQPDDNTTLPQTGQLWWPVPILAAAGLLLFLLGCLRKRGADDEG